VKSLPVGIFKPKGKNGHYIPVRGDEQLRQLIATTSQDYLLCVCSSGRVFQIAAHRIPEGTRGAKGEALRSLLELAPGEEIIATLPVDAYDEHRYLVTFSKLGKVKKSPLSEYRTVDVDGAQDMKLAEGDNVVVALLSRGQGEYLVTTDTAQTLRFSDENLRSQGRVGQGVAAMALGKNATVVSAVYLDGEPVEAGEFLFLFVVTRNGIGKNVPIEQYPQKGRATAGVVSTELQAGDHVLLTMLVTNEDTLLVTWPGKSGDQVSVLKASEIKAFPRARSGVSLVDGPVTGIVKI
jgi:DNA gyrase subunit A